MYLHKTIKYDKGPDNKDQVHKMQKKKHSQKQ